MAVEASITPVAYTDLHSNAGEIEAFSQNIQQSRTGFNFNAMVNAIDFQGDVGTRNKW
jgi:hypothetical protein